MTYEDLPEERHEEYALDVVARDAAAEILGGRGYVLLEDHFDPSSVLDLVERCVEHHVARGGETVSGGHRPDGVMLSSRVQDLMVDPLLLRIGELCLGSRPAFGSLGANSVPPGSGGMDPHLDYPYFAMAPNLPPRGFPALCVQLIWYLVDVDEGCAPTIFVPGTQVAPSVPRPFPYRSCPAKAGSVFVGHGALWHGVGPNSTDRTRHALLGSYVPFWVHPMLRPTAFTSFSEEMDLLLRKDFGKRMGEGYSRTVSSVRGAHDDYRSAYREGVASRAEEPGERHRAEESVWAEARRVGRELDEATERKVRELEIDDG